MLCVLYTILYSCYKKCFLPSLNEINLDQIKGIGLINNQLELFVKSEIFPYIYFCL